nr:hypothetical protein [Tanacetum cinerariifolium]
MRTTIDQRVLKEAQANEHDHPPKCTKNHRARSRWRSSIENVPRLLSKAQRPGKHNRNTNEMNILEF